MHDRIVSNNPLILIDPLGLCSVARTLDWIQGGLDAIGIFDPSPISDGISGIISLGRGDYLGASASGIAMFPYLGDLIGKGGKYGLKYGDEVIGAANKVSKSGSKFWSKTEFNGQKVYQRNDLINPKLVDARGRTNLERMQKGLAPVGRPDGKSINLHHSLQTNDSALVEISQTFHQQNTKTIHINPSSTPSGIDRNAFNAFKRDYWKSRANDF